MAKLLILKDDPTGADYEFYCPGCKCDHAVWTTVKNGMNAIWGFNGDIDHPTFTPSILIHFHSQVKGMDMVCHSFVTNGSIQFLSDCTHALAGQTVEMEDIE